jgi:ribulose-5-phosphate 4-epimerase/fuculose-1-phosphate aldolase
MTAETEKLKTAIRDLVIANRVLAHEGVVDAFGHVSLRHPGNPGRYLLARSRSPELVTEDDIMEFDLDSNPVDQRGRAIYAERPIHGCIYAARPEVMAVCHNHAHSLIPFGVTATPIRPIFHFSAGIGSEVPIWDIRDEFGDRTNLLVVNNAQGRSLAKTLGKGRACLMRGHGSAVATHDIKATVLVAISLMQNAALLGEARKMGEVTFLSEGEIAALADVLFGPLALTRGWEYWARRAGFATGEAE